MIRPRRLCSLTAAAAVAVAAASAAPAAGAASTASADSVTPIVCLPQRPEFCITDDPNCLIDANWRCWPQELLPATTSSARARA